MRNRKSNITLIIILIGQILIPLIIFFNEKFIVANSETETFEVESLKMDFKNRSVSLEIKTASVGLAENESESFYDGLARGNRVTAYEVKTYIDTNYLKVVPRDAFVGKNMIVNDICRADMDSLPYNYLKGDELSEIKRSMNGADQIHIVADVNYLNGACVVSDIYINDVDYMQYINENYYELLILDDEDDEEN